MRFRNDPQTVGGLHHGDSFYADNFVEPLIKTGKTAGSGEELIVCVGLVTGSTHSFNKDDAARGVNTVELARPRE
ncbi:hypothetical protein [Alienimonas sp. DA493]|uniref:hypothetical protein n=1 Tax=Alienimonas sp. DA493 TaxID=3373605 RepID=UPI0037541D10